MLTGNFKKPRTIKTGKRLEHSQVSLSIKSRPADSITAPRQITFVCFDFEGWERTSLV